MRVALKGDVSREDVENLAWDLDWLLAEMADPSGDRPYEDVWATADERTAIHYIEDPVLELSYLVVEGGDVDAVVDQIRGAVGTYTPQEALEALRMASSRDEKIEAIYLLAIASGNEDNEVLTALSKAAEDKDADVRHSVVVATGYLGWRQLRVLLERMRDGDQTQSVRDDAALMLEALDREPPR